MLYVVRSMSVVLAFSAILARDYDTFLVMNKIYFSFVLFFNNIYLTVTINTKLTVYKLQNIKTLLTVQVWSVQTE